MKKHTESIRGKVNDGINSQVLSIRLVVIGFYKYLLILIIHYFEKLNKGFNLRNCIE